MLLLPLGTVYRSRLKLAMVVKTDPRTQEAKEGRLWVGGQPGLYTSTLSQEKEERNKERARGKGGKQGERRRSTGFNSCLALSIKGRQPLQELRCLATGKYPVTYHLQWGLTDRSLTHKAVCSLHVQFHVALLCEAHDTVVTPVGPLASVFLHVHLQRTLLVEGFLTESAVERPLPWMQM